MAGGNKLSMEIFLIYAKWNYLFPSEFAFLQNGSTQDSHFLLFSNLGLITAQQTSTHIYYFMAGGWHTSCHPILKMHIVGEGPGETPSALRCLSYLISLFLTDIKHLAKSWQRGILSVPFWCLCQKLSLFLWYLNKTLLHKKPQVTLLHC